jgi:eukaryotic-like serine/threonine-protein kinase
MRLPARYEKVGSPFSGGGMSTAFQCKDKHLGLLPVWRTPR